MSYESHLVIEEIVLLPSAEWNAVSRCWRFVCITEGQGYWLGAPSPRGLNTGDVMVVSPETTGLFRASQLGQVRLHQFQFCPELLTGLLTLSERHRLAEQATRRRLAVRFVEASHPLAGRFGALCVGKAKLNLLRQRSQLLDLAGAVFGDETDDDLKRPSRLASAFERFQQLVHQLPEADIIHFTPEQLAQRCGCSVRHVGRLFQRQFGTSIRAKQAEVRLERARQLLSETDEMVREIARQSGYRHFGLFNLMFKRRFGVTPRQWRLQNSANRSPKPSGS